MNGTTAQNHHGRDREVVRAVKIGTARAIKGGCSGPLASTNATQ